MCGIGGILFAEEPIEERLTLLHSKLSHRGPDGQALWIKGRHGLCHHRLSLLDLEGGSQPFADPSGRYLLLYNGEIYNYQELRLQLSSTYPFVTSSDTEVVLAAFITWGSACVDYFNGMFALFIWDTYEEKGFAARDPLGVKPFVYAYIDHTFYFASELKALRALFPKAKINEQELYNYLITPYFSGAGSDSLFEGIHYLEPGTLLFLDKKGFKTQTYYSLQWKEPTLDEKELAEKIGTLLERSVHRCLEADHPVGLFLSGGLDSSLIAAIASSQIKIPSFSIAFKDHAQILFERESIVHTDDLPYAEQLAMNLQLPFHTIDGSFASLPMTLKEIAFINDRIPVWEQELSQYALAKGARPFVKAVLVGDSADELHYGYYFLLNGLGDEKFGESQRIRLLKSPEKIARKNRSNWLHRITHEWLGRLLHNGDIYTMVHGLEARVPFACLDLLEMSLTVPLEWGFKQGIEKALLRKSASKWLQSPFVERKKSALSRDPRLGPAYRALLKEELPKRGDLIDTYLNRRELLAFLEQPTMNECNRMICFNLLSLFYWSDHYG